MKSMEIIDLNDPEYQDSVHPTDGFQSGVEKLKKKLSEVADGNEIVVLRLIDKFTTRVLFLAPMSRVEISIK